MDWDWRKVTLDELLGGCSFINDEVSCSTPTKLAKLPCPINDLADEDLAAIFQRLPPYERLIVSEVCRRWHDLGRKSWLDVKTLDLSAIPGKHIAAVIRQCASLQHVFAVKKWFGLNELFGLSKIPSLARARFYECHFEVTRSASEAFSAIFSDHLRQATWIELVMHDATLYVHAKAHAEDDDEQKFDEDDDKSEGGEDESGDEKEESEEDEYEESDDDEDWPGLYFSAKALPASLRRLQLSGLRCVDDRMLNPNSLLHGLERLENLECLILHNTPDPFGFSSGYDSEQLTGNALDESEVFEQICCLRKLKELCLGPVDAIFEDRELSRSLADLPPKLEVLFLNDVVGSDNADDLVKFVGRNSDLRIFVLSGSFKAHRRLEADARIPPLHVFLGKKASAKIQFASKPTAPNTAVVHPIDAPMPEFLEREDIAPLFEGVWVAEKIKELAKTGGRLWRYASDH